MENIGQVTHFFARIMVAIIELSGELKKGDRICIQGSSTDSEQTVDSMQVDYQDIAEAKAGDKVGLKVTAKAKAGDTVYKVED